MRLTPQHDQAHQHCTSLVHFTLLFECWAVLCYIDMVMRFGTSQYLRQIVRTQRTHYDDATLALTIKQLAHAVDLASIFYFKKVRCLQHSAATTILFRRHGWRAEMVTGAQILPAEFHAWAEVDGQVVNDKPYMREIYQILERC
jgi:hypothetical protein